MPSAQLIKKQGVPVSATVLPEHSHHNELSKRFPNVFLVVQDTALKFLKRFSQGHIEPTISWEYISLSNGGFYLRLKSENPIRLYIPETNYYSTLSADAASIIINLYTYASLKRELGYDFLSEHYNLLHRFAGFHIEGSDILEALN